MSVSYVQRSARRRNDLAGLVLGCAGALGCSIVNRIDACEQPAPTSYEANLRTDGSQALDGVGSLVALPDHGAFLAFTSAVSNDDDGTGAAAIRGVVLDGAGRPQRTCGVDGEAEYELASGAGTRADQPSVAMPSVTGEDTGLLVWRARDGVGQRVRGRFVTRAGCAMASAFTVSGADAARVERPSVAWLGRRRFVVTWTSVGATATLRGLARVVEYEITAAPGFPPTEPAPDGAAVNLVPVGNGASYLRATSLGTGSFLATWYDPIALRPSMATFDDRLHAAAAARGASDVPPRTGAPTRLTGGNHLAFASDGVQILGAWTEADASDARRLRARFFSPAGEPLRAPVAPNGESFTLSDVAATEEAVVALAPMQRGGFFAVWEDTTLSASRARALRAVVFAPDGARRFSPMVCDATSFDPTVGAAGTQRSPTVVRLADGALLLAWTAENAGGADRSGTSVRALRLPLERLILVP